MDRMYNGSHAYLSVCMALLVFIPLQLFAFPELVIRDRNNARLRSVEYDVRGDDIRIEVRIYNEGDGDLNWNVEIPEHDPEWIRVASVPNNRVVRQGFQNFTLILFDTNLEADQNYFGTMRFTSNDPTAEVLDVPIAGHMGTFPGITPSWPGEWGDWWGIDMNLVYDLVEWGETYQFFITVRNSGGAQLRVDDVPSDNGYFVIEPDTFSLDGGNARQIRILFSAEEVGYTTATITSTSNVWDPREMSFRMVGHVEPSFKKVDVLPDTTIDEDAPELLLADLDTVFRCSDINNIQYQLQAEGLTYRVGRNHELFIRSARDWHGMTQAIITATLADSTLRDTFEVVINSVEDPPRAFDLMLPYDLDTLNFLEDSLFIWQSSTDPDEGDTVTYNLQILIQDDNMEWNVVVYEFPNLEDTTLSIEILKEVFVNFTEEITFGWTVVASDGDDVTEAWSHFVNYIPILSAESHVESPTGFGLVGAYPNPFNNTINIQINIPSPTNVNLSVYDQTGRLVSRVLNKTTLHRSSRVMWNPNGMPSGMYILRLDDGRTINELPVQLIK